jgi:hypothetical protein
VTPINIPTPVRDFEDRWQPLVGGQIQTVQSRRLRAWAPRVVLPKGAHNDTVGNILAQLPVHNLPEELLIR